MVIGHHLVVFVILADDLPHVRAGRNLESSDVAPAEIHAVIAEVRAAVEIFAGDQAVAGAYGQFGLDVGVTNRDDVFVGFGRLLVNFFLYRRVFLIDDDRAQSDG